MDLEKIKRFANSEFEGWKIAKGCHGGEKMKSKMPNKEEMLL